MIVATKNSEQSGKSWGMLFDSFNETLFGNLYTDKATTRAITRILRASGKFVRAGKMLPYF